MNSSLITKYNPAIILTLTLAVFLASCKLPTTTPSKSWVVSTLAGSGTAGYNTVPATGADAYFYSPRGVAVDSSGNVYVADFGNHRIRKIDTTTREVTTFAGSTEGYKDAIGTEAQFDFPSGVAVDSSGILYVADYGNHRIRKIIISTREVTTLAGSGIAGFANGAGTEAQFYYPSGVAVDSSGILYVADRSNYRIRKITSAGEVTTLAGSTEGHHDATGEAAQFNYPSGVAVDSSGNLYVADYSNHRIRKIIISTRVVSTFAGSDALGYHDATGTAAEFRFPYGVAVDSSGNLYVADHSDHRIRKITPEREVSTIAGSGTAGYNAVPATGTAAQFNLPYGVAVDSSGILYVADHNNHRIRKIEYK